MAVSLPVNNAFLGEYFLFSKRKKKCNSQRLNLNGPSNAETCHMHFSKTLSLKW